LQSPLAATPPVGEAVVPRTVGRLLRSEDFKRLLATRPRAKSAHFVLHHLPEMPSVPVRPARKAALSFAGGLVQASTGLTDSSQDSLTAGVVLSTGHQSAEPGLVDNTVQGVQEVTNETPCVSTVATPPLAPQALWLGCVVPKRLARRAVTRNLLRRQMRQVVQEAQTGLPGGIWLLRMRLGFDKSAYPSASSAALRTAAREELQRLVAGRGRDDRPRGDGGRPNRPGLRDRIS
jgi:ribonuclease P protein component